MRRRGIEPRPIAWKAIMLTTTPTPLFSGNQDASYRMHNLAKPDYIITTLCSKLETCVVRFQAHGLFVCLTSGCQSAHGRLNGNLLQLA